ncbi:MAG TPA: response regulator [Thermodesulfobacteriota bacterium]|nr:response regulator [Thermodesulfobacteriota bacterium]
MKTILIADEDSRVRNIVRLIFEPLNYRVVDTPSGIDAILKAREVKSDIVFADISLPGKDGYEVSREIKNNRILKNTSVILLTASGEAFDKTRAAEVSADDFATKPIKPEDVRKKVEFLILPKKERLKFFINPKREKNSTFAALMFPLFVVFIFTAAIIYETFDVNPFEAESNIQSTDSIDTNAPKANSKLTPAHKGEKRKVLFELEDYSTAKSQAIIDTPTQSRRLDRNEIFIEESEVKKESIAEEIPEESNEVEIKTATIPSSTVITPETQPYINLTGEWKLIHKVERTLYNPYKGMTLGYRVTLKQNGKNIMGKAEKWWEDGEKIPPTARSDILIIGTLDGRILTATFVEEGTLRTTGGSLVWTVSPDGKEFQGSFTSTAAGSSGISVGNKIL